MGKEFITSRQIISLIIMFTLGSTLTLGASSTVGQDSWISLLITTVLIIPVVLVFGRIMHLFPETDLFDIMHSLFGKILGKLLVLLITWYAIHLCAMLMSYFSLFIGITAMPETPLLPLMALMMLTTAYICKSGVETLGKWALAALPLVCFLVMFTLILSIKQMNFTNILPVFEHSPGQIVSGALQLLVLPYSEISIFMCLSGSIKKKDSPYKIYLYSVLLISAIYLLVMLRNLGVLDVPMMNSKYYSSFVTARVLFVGDFFTRMEGFISINFILTGVCKIAVCLLIGAKGIASLFGIQDYRKMVLPTGLFALCLGSLIYKNAMESVYFIQIYYYYFIPFALIIPLVIWITAEVKTRKNKTAQA